LMIVDGVNANRAAKVLEICKSKADFGAVKLLTHLPIENEHRVEIMPLNTLIAYSIFMLTEAFKYVTTPNVLIVQRDGFILNTSAWKNEWLDLDYIASIFVQYDHVGSGGFSLRSASMMKQIAETLPHWDGTQEHADKIQDRLGYYEDGIISFTPRKRRFKIASLDEAALFSQGGNRNPKYYRPHPFGFHGLWANIDVESGLVSPVCEHTQGGCECVMGFKSYLRSMENE
jgi:hypothetical protein